MGMMRRAVSKLFRGTIDGIVSDRLAASAISIGQEEDIGWRKLTGQPDRSLPAITQDRMIEICYWLWKTNPLGNWIIEIIKDYILGEGVSVDSDNERVKGVIDGFWEDPVNAMEINLEMLVRELFIYGEQCWPVYVAEQTGKVRLGYIDPAQISEVKTDPENARMVIGILLKGRGGETGRKYKTVLPRGALEMLSDEAMAMREQYTGGEAFFFAINRVSNAQRGTSELFVVADWLDAYEQFLFDYADKWPMLNTFVWDLLVKGADGNKLSEELKRFVTKSGSVYAHNEAVELTEKTPDLGSVEAETGARLLRNHILGAKSIPEHWFGGGGDVNRATALEMGAPAMKALSSKQKTVKYILERVMDYVIDAAVASRYLRGNQGDLGYTVTFPEMSTRDVSQYSVAIQQLSSALMIAEGQGWIGRDEATKSFLFGLKFLGLELDEAAVLEAQKGKKGREGYEDYEE